MTTSNNLPFPAASGRVFADPPAMAHAASTMIAEYAAMRLTQQDYFRIVLAGGTTFALTYQLLSRTAADWSRWRFYFGDERCVPPDDPARNSQLAWTTWLRPAGIDPRQVFEIPAELGAVAGAAAYTPDVIAALPFDLVLLGMGEDGHTASVFPGQISLADQLVMPVTHAPKPPPQRVTLTPAALCNAAWVLILVTGDSKRAAVAAWRDGAALPVAQIAAGSRSSVWCDEAALGNAI
ncbi:6-phosphogluconolactonase [Thiospirillum jenense]|uniref:6-phosphogluconolactonase n=1 Tax=Thiospirillum jenense TaxID=1653858 RepID=A0A839H6M4_9GAMM|nr:6-phosphogluconolactonase [Thiospirillum jenense]MBB1125405.1 6-phosphogluconolactonase [Thiospirillum jenense]